MSVWVCVTLGGWCRVCVCVSVSVSDVMSLSAAVANLNRALAGMLVGIWMVLTARVMGTMAGSAEVREAEPAMPGVTRVFSFHD